MCSYRQSFATHLRPSDANDKSHRDLFDGEISSILAAPLIFLPSLDHFIRSRKKFGECQSDLFRCLQVDHKLKLVACSTGRSAGPAASRILSQANHATRRSAVRLVRAVGHEPTGIYKFSIS